VGRGTSEEVTTAVLAERIERIKQRLKGVEDGFAAYREDEETAIRHSDIRTMEQAHVYPTECRRPAGRRAMMPEPAKHATDAAMATSAAAAMLEMLPDVLSIIAAVLSIIWFALRIWESETVKGWRRRK